MGACDNTSHVIPPDTRTVLRPLQLDASLIGKPLPWDVYTSAGVLVAGAGLVIADEAHFRKLGARDLFRGGEDDVAGDSPLDRLANLVKQAEDVLVKPEAGAILEWVRALRVLSRVDADACLGYVGLLPLARPSVIHAVRVLFVADVLAAQLDFSDSEQEMLAAAALTMNLASLELHDRLHASAGAPSDADRATLRGHPQASAAALEEAGVNDVMWLEAVRQHHENMNGSGYPAGLSSDAISLAARVLRVADYYCAKVGGRYYRPPRSASFAFQELFGRDRALLDSQIATQLLRRLGIYPPGTLVRLANRETACIARRAHGGSPRWAVSVLDGRERVLEPPRQRDLASRNHAILGTAERRPEWPTINWQAVWGY